MRLARCHCGRVPHVLAEFMRKSQYTIQKTDSVKMHEEWKRMKNMYRAIVGLVLTGSLIGTTGCMTAAKQAFYTVVGAQGKFYEVQVVNSHALSAYRTIRVEPFTNDLGKRVPLDVMTEVNEQTPTTLDESGLFYLEGKELLVRGRVIHYTGRTALEGSIMSVAGSAEECVCRVQLLDAESRELLGEAVCWGQTKSALRRGSGELGKGVGKGVAKWIRDRLPQQEVERRREELKQPPAEEEETEVHGEKQ